MTRDGEHLIRSARRDEADDLARVHHAAWHQGYAGIVPDEILSARSLAIFQEQWSEWLQSEDPDVNVLLAERGGQVVGLAELECREADDPELRLLYVHPSAWRSGVGRTLVGAVGEELRRRGAAHVVVWTFAENVRGRRFYEAVGWTLDDHGDWQGLPTVRYRRQLDP
jgi:GNAT superfamily N-acetyltransferase